MKPIAKKCDVLFSKIVRSIGYCERCGKREHLQTAHIYSRRHVATRWDLNNAVCLCGGCHLWAHQNPVDFAVWIEGYIGGDVIEMLRQRKNKIGQKIDHQSIYESLNEVYERNK